MSVNEVNPGYLMNAWYVASWSEDLTDAPLARQLLDVPVVLYRKTDGTPVALLDRCPHRFAPLSRGKVESDEIVCGYHGLRFDGSGRCVDARLKGQASAGANIRAFPVVDRYSALWIWMGDPAAADPDLIVDMSFMSDNNRRAIRGTTVVEANYQLELDNLMDLSHLDYVHLGTIANGSFTTGQYSARQDGDVVYSDWWSPDTLTPPQFVGNLPGVEKVDQWTEFQWHAPATLHLYSGVTRVGAPRNEGIEVLQGHFVTPQTQKKTLYFWCVTQDKKDLPIEAVDMVKAIVTKTFEHEDLPMLEAQQANMRGVDLWSEKPIFLAEDAGATRMRRVLEKLIAKEQLVPAEAKLESV